MEITVSRQEGPPPVTVFHLSGPFTQSDDLKRVAQEHYNQGMKNLILDLSDSPYMSSEGFRALHAIFMMLRDKNSPEESDAAMQKGIAAGTFASPHLKLLNPNDRVLQVLKIAGYDMFLAIYYDLKKALASFH